MLISASGLEQQQKTYQTISGVDLSHLCVGMIPAFRDLATDETHLSVTRTGKVSPIHLIENLPVEWVTEWNEHGFAVALKPSVIAGFYRCEKFYTLSDIENFLLDA